MDNFKPVLRVGRYQFTTLSLSEGVAALLLTILSLYLSVSGYRDYRLSTNFSQALLCFFSDQVAEASSALDAARKARPEYGPAQEFYAKSKIDGATLVTKDVTGLEEAIGLLDGLLARPNPPWTVLVSSAVARIKRADFSGDKAHLDDAARLLEQAMTAEPQAPEPLIELGHIALRRGDRAAAESWFKKCQEEEMGVPTIDGLLDLYLGRATLFLQTKRWNQARDEYLRAYALCPRGKLPLVNLIYIWAQIVAEQPPMAVEEVDKLNQDLNVTLSTLRPGHTWSLEMVTAYNRAKASLDNSFLCQWAHKRAIVNVSGYLRGSTPEAAEITDVWLNAGFGSLRSPGEPPSESFGQFLSYVFGEALKRKVPDVVKVAALNNLACAQYWTDSPAAEATMDLALKAANDLHEPPDAVLLRNRAVLYDKPKTRADAAKLYQASLAIDRNQPELDRRLKELK
ncbi:MAG: hypothetical protein HYZ53_28880 [Planctomycetes bacterium]|nr:hypothetical protein [Planctomycetota bacterium]